MGSVGSSEAGGAARPAADARRSGPRLAASASPARSLPSRRVAPRAELVRAKRKTPVGSRAASATTGAPRASPDPEPVRDLGVVRVERRQDEVHVEERREAREHVSHASTAATRPPGSPRARRAGRGIARGPASARRRTRPPARARPTRIVSRSGRRATRTLTTDEDEEDQGRRRRQRPGCAPTWNAVGQSGP